MNKFQGKCYLVTGAAGFIGSHLSERLVSLGAEVIGVDCLTDYYDPRLKKANIASLRAQPSFDFRSMNILELNLEALLPEVDGVFHQAAQAGVRASWGAEFDEYVDQNIRSTQYLLEAIKNYSPEIPCIVASSSSVYGIPKQLQMKESMKPEPYSPYGVTKLAAENLSMLYHDNFGLQTTALRYFTVYGPRQRPDMAFTRFLGWIYEGFPLTIFGDGSQSRDFTYVDDVVDANLACLRAKTDGEVFNVGGGRTATLTEVIELMEETVDRPVKKEYEDVQEGDVPHTDADTEAIRERTGWQPNTSLEEGMKNQWEWIKNNELLLQRLKKIRQNPTA